MKQITVDGADYRIEFSFEAAEYKDIVQQMFNLMSGAYIAKKVNENDSTAEQQAAMIDGTSEMIAVIPGVCNTAFYAGLLEHNAQSHEDAKKIMRGYMKEQGIGYRELYDELKACMEDDGFFKLSGLEQMINEINEKAEEQAKKPAPKKRTSTK